MSKNIVFPYVTFNQFFEEPIIKKLALFYDKIYIGDGRFNIIQTVDQKNLKEDNIPLLYEKAVWDFLRDNEVVKTYPFLKEKFDNEDEDAKQLIQQLEELHKQGITKREWPKNPNEEQLAEMKKEYFSHFFLSHDVSIRLDTLHLRKIDEFSEYYPLLRTYDTLKGENKKSQIIQFLLNDIPEPDYATSWDHIIEYRTDEDVRNKYLALLNWVNKVTNSNQKLSEIKEEYDYLYSEYIKHFNLHKMKHTNSTLEVIVNSTVNFVANVATGNYVTSVKDLFQFNIKNASLLQEEAKVPGKEVAYIFHTKNRFQ
ncbi:MAG: hypothetical protein JNM71_14700 [Flavobacterium lindanitolerans]|uniref:hypothetical protein n=1 Tax=Flavobacterium lindanitolerans TaxID=428988 RepID=UPI001A588F73|nr:hypothetical protein [Flavobacterium lindanitolerans]MBL7869263.1 hypothetical protein [Flavobacterium lindanitolerans]